jgi:hemophore-related protein
MIKLSLSRPAVAVGALAVSLTAGAGVASADPDLGPAINSTCTYSQFVSALNAQNPEVGAAFANSPAEEAGIRQFLASPPSRRVELAQRVLNSPAADKAVPILQQVFSVCNNY